MANNNNIIKAAVKAAKAENTAANLHKLYVDGKAALKGDVEAQGALFKALKEVRPDKDWYGKASYAAFPTERKAKAQASEPAPVKTGKTDSEGYVLDSKGVRVGHLDPKIDALMQDVQKQVSLYVEREKAKAEKAAKAKQAQAQKDAKAKSKRDGLLRDVDGNIVGAEDPALNALIQAGLKANAPKARKSASKKASK